MKHMNKILALALALIMILGLATTASAATVNNATSDHSYHAYQVFAGSQAESEGALGNVAWGSGVNGPALLEQLQNEYDYFDSCKTAEDVAKVLENQPDNCPEAKALANVAAEHLTEKYTAIAAGATSVEMETGYWLLVDVTDVDGETDAMNSALLQVTGNIEIAKKYNTPTVVKKVDDENDSVADKEDTEAVEGEDGKDWQDSADHDIGDAVPFLLTATLANNVSDYDTYKIVFHDTLSAGLTYNKDAVVKFGETNVTDKFTITEEGGKLTISCDDVKAFGATDSSIITVEYTATLNKNAVIGADGNPNTVNLEYSNNPNWVPSGNPDEKEPTGETPDDTVIVFTYKVVINKTDKDGNALAGAGFTLYKKNAEGVYEVVEVINAGVGDKQNVFSFEGLDDGDYKLEESTTPAGYNTIAPIEFTITAEHEIISDDPALESLLGGDLVTGEFKDTGAITADIINNAGTVLPETGGMGTILFYALGGLLVAAAVVLLVTKKRMASAE